MQARSVFYKDKERNLIGGVKDRNEEVMDPQQNTIYEPEMVISKPTWEEVKETVKSQKSSPEED